MFKLVVAAFLLVTGAPAPTLYDTYTHVTNGETTLFKTEAECHAAFEQSQALLRQHVLQLNGVNEGIEVQLREACERQKLDGDGTLDDHAADLLSAILRSMIRQGGFGHIGG